MLKNCLADIFTDGMIFQYGLPIRIYGYGENELKIHIWVNNTQGETVCIGGIWEIELPSLPVGGPYEMNITASDEEPHIIKDILSGDVFIAGGQSNMEMPLKSANLDEEILNDLELPFVRIYNVPLRPYSGCDIPGKDFVQEYSDKKSWRACTKEEAMEFSAVGYYFARRLKKDIDIPIGIITCTCGGTPISAWLPEDAQEIDADLKKVFDDYQLISNSLEQESYNRDFTEYIKNIEAFIALVTENIDNIKGVVCPVPPMGPKSYERPSGLFHGMLEKILRYNVRGMLWYQGETDSDFKRARSYKKSLQFLVEYIRRISENPKLYFILAQLPPFGGVELEEWAEICWQQQLLSTETPDCAMITLGDCGDIDVHPKNKEPVGSRFALAALNRIYGKNYEYCGPIPISCMKKGEFVEVEFSHISERLKIIGDDVGLFEICGNDLVFIKANVLLKNDSILLSSNEVVNPYAVRYAWSSFPHIGLFNSDHLPASLFYLELN